MGIRGIRIYHFTNEVLVAALENTLDERNKVIRRAAKFARKYGLWDKEWCAHLNYDCENGCGILGMTPYRMRYNRWAPPKNPLDSNIWMKIAPHNRFPYMYRPKKTPAAKKVRADWDAIGKWDMRDVMEIIGWKDIYDDEVFPMKVYRFNPWWTWVDNNKRLLCGFSHTLPAKKSLDYKPPRGLMTKLSISQYKKLTDSRVI
jgi:hypothetical protein